MDWAFWRREPARAGGAAAAHSSRRGDDDPPDLLLRPDPIAELRARTRRRLVGAAALLLAVVIVVPLILDPAPRPLPDHLPLTIPSERSAFTPGAVLPPTATVPLAPPAEPPDDMPPGDSGSAPGGAAVEPAAPDPQPASAVATAPAEGRKTAPPAGDPSAGRSANKPAAAPRGEEKGQGGPKVRPEGRPADGKPAASATPSTVRDAPDERATSEARRAQQALEGGAQVATGPRNPRFVVQAAALGSETAARELLERLKRTGLPAYTEKTQVAGEVRFRVRAGPFVTREDALLARARLRELGIDAQLAAP